MGQIVRQLSPNSTRYYWYPGEKKDWLRALLAVGAGACVFGLSYLVTRSTLTAAVLGLTVLTGVVGFNLGRRDLRALDDKAFDKGRREAIGASGRATWRGLVQGGVAALAVLTIAHLPARGLVADWLLPLVPAVVGALARQAGLLSGRFARESEKASAYATTASRSPHSTDAVGEPGAAV
ncbi:hypothetical protein KZZ52_07770 [Dactylosporangium sp. AC04546]|uniref:hypothetical protein n=1 Tax=Dactylosporangium sp. AC04546 TaxID=2862460 RepID=UPI001EDE148C|nr:hypothetical protein [Dactylosporangium sp. AC04546]WVK85283.1 hypothetical protein KZZ52_07770 [Dactylosporangium sp. AC04546]